MPRAPPAPAPGQREVLRDCPRRRVAATGLARFEQLLMIAPSRDSSTAPTAGCSSGAKLAERTHHRR